LAEWNLWHGCHKISEGCRNCYVYRADAKHGRDSSAVAKTGNFNLPVKRNRQREYKIPSGETVNTCFTSDMDVSTNGNVTLNEARDVAEQVHLDIETKFPKVKNCMIPMNPLNMISGSSNGA